MAENCSNGFPDAEHFPWHLYAGAQYDDCFTRSFLPSNNGFSEDTVSRELAGHHGEAFQKPINSGGWEGSDDDVDEHQPTRPADKQQHCKNLFAERKRRQKLKDRLFALRSLVPKITKMDRASILGDAIEYVTDLQKQVKDLQEELELELEANGDRVTELEVEIPTDPKQDCSRGQRMEPQVEVRALDANELFLTVLCEHRHGGFARLVEAMAALGLQIASVNVTTFRDLVLNVFRVERRNDEVNEEVVEAVQYLRESLLEATRDAPPSCWSDQLAQERGSGGGDQRQDSHGGRSPAVRLRSSPPLPSSPSVVASWLHSC